MYIPATLFQAMPTLAYTVKSYPAQVTVFIASIFFANVPSHRIPLAFGTISCASKNRVESAEGTGFGGLVCSAYFLIAAFCALSHQYGLLIFRIVVF